MNINIHDCIIVPNAKNPAFVKAQLEKKFPEIGTFRVVKDQVRAIFYGHSNFLKAEIKPYQDYAQKVISNFSNSEAVAA